VRRPTDRPHRDMIVVAIVNADPRTVMSSRDVPKLQSVEQNPTTATIVKSQRTKVTGDDAGPLLTFARKITRWPVKPILVMTGKSDCDFRRRQSARHNRATTTMPETKKNLLPYQGLGIDDCMRFK
jgi:hypothetical protein